MMKEHSTKARSLMSSLEHFYKTTSSHKSLEEIKKKKWKKLMEIGLPNKYCEEYKYSNIDKILNNFFFHNQIKNSIYFNFYECDRYLNLYISNHKNNFGDSHNINNLIISNSITDHFKKIFDVFSKNILEILLDAISEKFILISIPPNTNLEKPIFVNYNLDSPNLNLINLNFDIYENSKVEIFSSKISKTSVEHLTYVNTKVNIEKNSNVILHTVQANNDNIIHNLSVNIHDNAFFDSNFFSFNNKFARNNFFCYINGENSIVNFNGLCYSKDLNHTDNFLNIEHLKANSCSNQLFKKIVKGNSKSIFTGKIYVDKLAQKTNAFQLNKNLILSEKSKIKTRPQLEIYADDVKCSHGATIGKIDDEHLLYLTSRGISLEIAKKMLVYAFNEELFLKIKNLHFRDIIIKVFKDEIL